MAENSIFWTTGATGDGLNPYTQAELVNFVWRKFFGVGANEGVLKGVGGELEVTGTSSPVAVADGAAVCYGFPYENDASANVAIPTPSSATRIDLVVLRVDWSAQTVRITRVAGTEGAGAPSLTQTAGTTWDIPLAQCSITTGGVITVTDTREFAHFSSGVDEDMLDAAALSARLSGGDGSLLDIASGAIDTARLANNAVDDTKLGDRAPQFYRRQGGDVSDWSTPGTTSRTPGAVRMQGGVRALAAGLNQYAASLSVTFPTAFSQPPLVFVTQEDGDDMGDGDVQVVWADNITASGFSLRIRSTQNTVQVAADVQWVAIGPE